MSPSLPCLVLLHCSLCIRGMSWCTTSCISSLFSPSRVHRLLSWKMIMVSLWWTWKDETESLNELPSPRNEAGETSEEASLLSFLLRQWKMVRQSKRPFSFPSQRLSLKPISLSVSSVKKLIALDFGSFITILRRHEQENKKESRKLMSKRLISGCSLTWRREENKENLWQDPRLGPREVIVRSKVMYISLPSVAGEKTMEMKTRKFPWQEEAFKNSLSLTLEKSRKNMYKRRFRRRVMKSKKEVQMRILK